MMLLMLMTLTCMTSYWSWAQSVTSLDSLVRQFESEVSDEILSFEEYAGQAKEEYEQYQAQAMADFARYLGNIEDVWGADDAKTDSKTEWVEYSDDFSSRSIVDFSTGKITLQVRVSDNDSEDDINAKISEAVARMLSSRGSTCPYESSVDVSEPLSSAPVLDGLVDFSAYRFDDMPVASAVPATPVAAVPVPPKPVTKGKKLDIKGTSRKNTQNTGTTMASEVLERERLEEERRIAERLAAEKAAEEQMASDEGSDGSSDPLPDIQSIASAVAVQSEKTVKEEADGEKVVTVQMSLVENNLSKNAALYSDIVATYSAEFEIEPALIFAVMEQESSFNPEATSWVPAYGLMQLVPTSGGFDAYRYVYKKEWVPTRSYLYVPKNNIELGTAYLRVLMNQFSSVSDPDCRRLCVIASYNTGAGNVSRAFTGSVNLTRALPLINGYDYDRLYRHLTSNLSTEEARNYVSGVSKRRAKYLK